MLDEAVSWRTKIGRNDNVYGYAIVTAAAVSEEWGGERSSDLEVVGGHGRCFFVATARAALAAELQPLRRRMQWTAPHATAVGKSHK